MDHPFHYLGEPAEREGTGLGVAVSVSVHLALLLFVFLSFQSAAKTTPEEPPIQFVDLVPQLPMQAQQGGPQVFTEAPGPAIPDPANPAAALSDANRRATMPDPTGSRRTSRPGDGGGLYVPGPQAPSGQDAGASRPSPPPASAGKGEQGQGAGDGTERGAEAPADGLQYRTSAPSSQVAQASDIDWREAIREAGRAGSSGGGGRVGGEAGFAESGPISFETQWYDWGPYAAQMVAKIRVHWYSNMPEVIRLGLKGVVVIRFTIQRNGQITDVTLLQSSGVPPYDFAARKAIELASPLAPLPADFPEPYERVTAAFYYNQNPPAR